MKKVELSELLNSRPEKIENKLQVLFVGGKWWN